MDLIGIGGVLRGGAGSSGTGPSGQPPKKKRRTMPTMTVTSGLKSDVVKFQWKIENFAAIRHSKPMLQSQIFTLDLGGPVGVPCKWQFSVASETEIIPAGAVVPGAAANGSPPQPAAGPKVVEWLEIIRKLVQVPEDGDEICNCCSIKIKDKDRKSVFKGYGTVNSLKVNGYRTFKKVLRLSDKSSELPLVDGALVIDFTVTTFANGPVTMLDTTTMGEFKGVAGDKLSMDLSKLLKGSGGAGYSDIKVVSKDGKEFHAHKCILAARNSVFQAMFASNLSELQSGVIRVEDLTGKTMELLLKYIYGGIMDESWFQPDTIVELTYAAGKYQLTEVLQFLDKILGTKGKGENAGVLLALAEKLGLKNAEKELVAYVKKEAVPAAESYQDLLAIFGSSNFPSSQ